MNTAPAASNARVSSNPVRGPMELGESALPPPSLPISIGRTLRTADRFDRAGHRDASISVDARPHPGVVAKIHELYRQLSHAPSLEPSPHINQLFTELVGLTSGADVLLSSATLKDPSIREILPHLRQLCARGEALLEHHWFEKVHGSDDPSRAIEGFPYYGNYKDLTRMEVQSMGIAGELPKKVLFIGSGSLPLTSILLAQEYGMQVDNIDIEKRATQEGELLARDLGLGPERMRFEHTDVKGLKPEQLAQYDAFYVAALAGLDPKAKKEIFGRIAEHARPGALILARSSHRLRSLLYPEVEPEDIRGFEPQVVVHPFTDVVNSVVVARKSSEEQLT